MAATLMKPHAENRVTALPVATFPSIPPATNGNAKRCNRKSLCGTGRRRTPSSTWSGIRPVERQLMRPWLIKKIDAGETPGLEWVDVAKTRFRIPWKHGSRQCWKSDSDAALFKCWAVHTGRFRVEESPNPKRWKANFRCAINSLPDAREVKEESQTRGQNAYRVYEFLPEKKHRPNTARHGGKKSDENIKKEKPCVFDAPSNPCSRTTAALNTPQLLERLNSFPSPATSTQSPASHSLQLKMMDDEASTMSCPGSPSSLSSSSDSLSSTSSLNSQSIYSQRASNHRVPCTSSNWVQQIDNDSYCPPNVATYPTSGASVPGDLKWASQVRTPTTVTSHQPAFSCASDDVRASPNSSTLSFTTSPTSFPTATLTSQATTPFFPGASQPLPTLMLDLAVTSHIDYDSGLGSPSSPGSSVSNNDIDCYAYPDEFSDSRSEASVEIANPNIQEVIKEYLLKSSQTEPYRPNQTAPARRDHPYQRPASYIPQERQQCLSYQMQPSQQPESYIGLQSNQVQSAPQSPTDSCRHAQQLGTSINTTGTGEELTRLDADEVETMLDQKWLDIAYSITVTSSTHDPSANTMSASFTTHLNGPNSSSQ